MISIVNVSGSGVKIKIRKIKVHNCQTSSISGVISEFLFRRISGHSSGSALTAAAHDTEDNLNGSITIKTGATVSGEASDSLAKWFYTSEEWGGAALKTADFEHTMAQVNAAYESFNPEKPITLNEGEGVHIKHATNSTSGCFDFLIVFTQE
jgi:glucosamine 6-phosphate synthetase-like amidotransferase/phosphosugar isomerase protein